MFVTLLKKQLLEINWTFFVDKKTNKVKPKGKVISSILLFAVLMLIVAFSMSTMSIEIIQLAVEINAGWFAFTFTGILAMIFGVVGSVFNTYGMLYKSKDNELLISLPIKPEDILLSRVASALVMALLYTSLVMVPAIILYQVFAGFNFVVLIASVLMLLVEAVFVTVLTCALGYVLAIATSKIKNKAIVSVVSTLVFLAVYYMFVFKLDTIILDLLTNIEEIAASVSANYLLYVLGNSYMGKPLAMLAFIIVTAALAYATVKIMSMNFVKITSIKDAKSNKKFESKQIKQSGIKPTLIKKEITKILNTPTYLLNAGLGIVFMLVAAGAIIFKGGDLMNGLNQLIYLDPELYMIALEVLPAAILLTVGMLISMDSFTASSISLEGKTLWQLQSLPVDFKEVINAKALTSIILNGVPAVIAAIAAALSLKLDSTGFVISVVGVLVLDYFFAYFGLFTNILFPNFVWTNETRVVKQSGAVTLALFGGWAVIALLVGCGFLFVFKLALTSVTNYMLIAIAVLYVAAFILKRFCEKKGSQLLKGN